MLTAPESLGAGMHSSTHPARSELLGARFACACGKTHAVPTEKFIYGPTAFNSLAQVVGDFSPDSRIVVIDDARTHQAAGRKVLHLLQAADFAAVHYLVPDQGGESPRADDRTKDMLLAELADGDLYVAVGSGVINDLVKWVAYLRKKPYVVVPTAASMNGYASANVAATVAGLKVLFHAAPCRAVLADAEVVASAPFALTTAGLGDVLAKSVSAADWKLNQLLFQDYYCQYAVDLLHDLEPVYLDNPEGIKNCRPEAMEALFMALFYSSLAMTMTGTSSPASGGEHLISHTLDMTADRDGRHHDLHGRQVGVASILMAALYERVMAIEKPDLVQFPTNIDEQFWGTLAPVVAEEYRRKLPRIDIAARAFGDPQQWQLIRTTIRPHLIAAKRLKGCLARSGGAHRCSDIRDNGGPLTLAKFTDTVRCANQMRSRFTILDVAVMLGVIPNQLDDLIGEWVTD
jgi:glycerol-1-phosphate dehydrogenase [NAD(P)+]